MYYSNYYPIDVLNGEGTRCTLFVSGCIHQCKGCYNQSTWSVTAGRPFTDAIADQIIEDLQDPRVKKKGLSLTGGDPLHPNNTNTVLRLIKRVKKECVGKDIWLWSGYTLSELNTEQQCIIDLVDVFIGGKFELNHADLNLKWRGSKNQVIYHFK